MEAPDDRLSQVEKAVAAHGQMLLHMQETLETISTRLNRPQNWVGMVGLTIVLLTGGGTYINMQTKVLANAINRVEANAIKTSDRFQDHRTIKGHLGVEGFEKQLEEMDRKLQIEIGRVEDLLETEIRLNIKTVDTRIDGVERRFND